MAEGVGHLVAGRYRLTALLGRGAMGAVWRAHDEELDREVAVKQLLLPDHLDAEESRLRHARAAKEARAAARLKHPGIVAIHDRLTGQDGRPWIVMELVDGPSLHTVLAEHGPLPPVTVAAMGTQVLAALRAAHAAGIVHRDVKPANVLLEHDRVVLTDFGIAAIDGDATLTRSGTVLGTPAFMSPEQVHGLPATPASDLWALGATLYAALEGRPPFTGPTPGAVYVAIATGEPSPPRNAGPLLPVVTGLLRKDPADRLPADRLAALLASAAYPSDPTHPPAPVGPSDLLRPSEQAASRPEPDQPTHALTRIEIAPGPHPTPTGAIEPAPRRRRRARIAAIVITPLLAGTAGMIAAQRTSDDHPAHPRTVTSVARLVIPDLASTTAFSPDGRLLAVGSYDHTVRLFDVRTRRQVGQPFASLNQAIDSVAFSPDGKLLATGSDDHTDHTARLWDVHTGRQIGQPLTGHTSYEIKVAFSPDGKLLATCSDDHTARLWDVHTGQQIGNPITPGSQFVTSVAFSPDGRLLATAGGDHMVQFWDVNTRRQVGAPLTEPAQINSLAFSSDGGTIATGGVQGVRLWNVRTRQPLGGLLNGDAYTIVTAVAISPDGHTVASSNGLDADHSVNLWSIDTHQRIGAPLNGHSLAVNSVAFNHDGTLLATASEDHSVRLWDTSSLVPGHPSALPAWTYLAIGSAASATLALILWRRRRQRPDQPTP